MGKTSREKGKRGEREIAELLRSLGYMDAHRTAQYCGKSGEAADVIGVDGLHLEVKRCETTKIHEWMRQAERDSEDTNDIPCVFHKRNREPWYVTLPAIDFLQVYKGGLNMELIEYQELAQRTSNGKPEHDKLENGIMGLNGESGECIDILKKHKFQGHELDKEKLIDELGDVLWYVAETASGLEMTLEDIAWHNIEKLKKRYPDGFDSERSQHREA